MKIQISLLILCLSLGCLSPSENSNAEIVNLAPKKVEASRETQQHQKKNPLLHLQQLSINQDSDDYETVKKQIEFKRNQLAVNNLPIDTISKIFKESLLNRIIPFWEGTAWSFEGHTSSPKSGKIACGYFVSTTLQDIGLHVNRYKLAQQSPINEAKSLAINVAVKEFSEGLTSDNISGINNYLKEGIHFIGFDESHVGYILKEKGKLYLIHSNYIGAVGVVIEPIEASEVFKSFRKFYLVELSTNKHLLNYWLDKKNIKIIKK